MNIRLSILLILVLLLSGCTAAAPTAALTATAMLPVASFTVESTVTAAILTPTVETPTVESLPTSLPATALPSTATLEPTATAGGMTMVIVPDSGQPTLPRSSVAGSAACPPPTNWVRYIVKASDTLSSLGQSTGVGWQRIQAANCLAGTLILAGQPLYLPLIPKAAPVAANAAVETMEYPSSPPYTNTPEVLTAVGPGSPTVAISPQTGQPGVVFTFQVSGFTASEKITIHIIYGRDVKSIYEAAVDGSGNLAFFYPSPVGAPSGSYIVDVSGAAHSAVGSFTIQ